jgi:Asp-tRNA(Asn)/Glu-tRNA(Gln) amidotransferase A subunit family amidase
MPLELYDAPLAATVAALRAGELDPVAYVDELCDRAEAIDGAILSLLPEPGRRERLRAEAAALRERWPDPGSRPPLYGVPVGVKDIFRVDGFPTRCGSALPPELFVGPEAESVAILRRAGALVLGKTVTTEFAAFEPGATANPRNPGHTPGGSSSGSAAAVAAGLCPLALGSQTVGSVIRPAAFCGVVGFKPSYGRIPTTGVIPYSPSVDHVGFFAQDVAGARLAASVLCDDWRADAAQVGDRTLVIALPDGPYVPPATADGLAALERQLAALAEAGYTVKRVPAFADIAAITERHRRLAVAELAVVHRDWFAGYGALYRPRTVGLIRDGQTVGAEELNAALAGRLSLRAELATLLRDAGADLWIAPPARGVAPEGLGATGDPIVNAPWTHAGVPAITVPAGHNARGLPFGAQLIAPHGSDEQLLAWAEPIAVVLAAVGLVS